MQVANLNNNLYNSFLTTIYCYFADFAIYLKTHISLSKLKVAKQKHD